MRETASEKVRKYNEQKGKLLKYYITTFGCQMNAHDSEKLSGILEEMGYIKAENEEDSDIVVYNTCCVRENAENRVYGRLGYLKNIKKNKKGFKIILCGCMMQQEAVVERIQKTYGFVDVIFGTFNIYRLAELLCANIETGSMIIDIWREHNEVSEDLPSVRELSHKAGVNIMYGCNNFCSYCIVPYVRGRERSRPSRDIINEIERMTAEGVTEVLLLGQNVNSYAPDSDINFPKLLAKINGIDGLQRIRFLTSHPKDMSDELIDAVAELDKVCNYIHLPFQSGSTEILNKMNRKYTKEGYLSLVQKIKNKIPEVSLTTDIIVGFPGETESDFCDTLDVVNSVRFNGAFTFLYSKRSGTKAAALDGQIPADVADERFKRLLDAVNPIVFEKNKESVGKIFKVIPDKIDETTGILSGRAEDNNNVHFKGGKALLGKITSVEIIEAKPFYLMGKIN